MKIIFQNKISKIAQKKKVHAEHFTKQANYNWVLPGKSPDIILLFNKG